MCVQGFGSLLRHLKSHIERYVNLTLNLILSKLILFIYIYLICLKMNYMTYCMILYVIYNTATAGNRELESIQRTSIYLTHGFTRILKQGKRIATFSLFYGLD